MRRVALLLDRLSALVTERTDREHQWAQAQQRLDAAQAGLGVFDNLIVALRQFW